MAPSSAPSTSRSHSADSAHSSKRPEPFGALFHEWRHERGRGRADQVGVGGSERGAQRPLADRVTDDGQERCHHGAPEEGQGEQPERFRLIAVRRLDDQEVDEHGRCNDAEREAEQDEHGPRLSSARGAGLPVAEPGWRL